MCCHVTTAADVALCVPAAVPWEREQGEVSDSVKGGKLTGGGMRALSWRSYFKPAGGEALEARTACGLTYFGGRG